MGWKESNRVSERLELCRLYEGGSLSMAELCRRFGVSRKTGQRLGIATKLKCPGGLGIKRC